MSDYNRLPADPATQATMANAIRFLAMDAVQQANSGHPGAPMGMAEIALALWGEHLSHNPKDPHWFNRDRFVLSNGHGSMLIYALLHLTGYDLDIEALKNFRQLHGRTPGHPEVDETPGVETTTGPLGQGVANAFGMALAEKLLGQEFNREGHDIVDHYTWVFLGDGCLMEGISHEACSFAGTLGLGKFIVLYDDNNISIDGEVGDWFTDDTPQRFASYGWQVIEGIDGHSVADVSRAIQEAKANTSQPTLICCKTIIGKGSPNKEGTHGVHGAPLGAEEIAASRAALGWDHPPFVVPSAIQEAWDASTTGAQAQAAWQAKFDAYAAQYPELAAELTRRMQGVLPADFGKKFEAAAQAIVADTSDLPTRTSSQKALGVLGSLLPELLGGSADLTGSNQTNFTGCTRLVPGKWGNYISWGVREFGMSAAMNGIALHGGYLPYGGTYLTFSDYGRNAVRLAALMKRRVVFVFTHDSIGVGEDGPTHQSIEHMPSLRLIPNLDVWRPADSLETLVAWHSAIERADGPTAMAFSRQNVPSLHSDASQYHDIAKGGYILHDVPDPQAILIGTGSETALAVEAQQQLKAQGISVRVVSMPCTNIFDRQSKEYQQSILPSHVPKVVIEAAHPDLWRKYVGPDGDIVGIDHFGVAAPAGVLFKLFGITAEALVERVTQLLSK